MYRRSMAWYLVLAVVLLLDLSACIDTQITERTEPQPPTVGTDHAVTSTAEPITYTVIEQYGDRRVHLRLDGKIGREELRDLGIKLKSQNPRYELIFFYLPGMATESDPWARALFDQSLALEIDIGLSQEDEKQLLEVLQNQRQDVIVIGRWFHHSIIDSRMSTIFRRGEKLYLEETYTYGYNNMIEINERASLLGRRFDKAEGSSAGDHWIIDSIGNLQLRDDYGLVETGSKVESPSKTNRLPSTYTTVDSTAMSDEEAAFQDLFEWLQKERESARRASAYATPVPTTTPTQ